MSNEAKHTPNDLQVADWTEMPAGLPDGWVAIHSEKDGGCVGYCRADVAPIFAAAPALLAACEEAAQIIKTARQYYPTSIRNADTFALENTCATVGAAIAKAKTGA